MCALVVVFLLSAHGPVADCAEGPPVQGPGAKATPLVASEDTSVRVQSLAELMKRDQVPCQFPALPDWQHPDYCGINCLYAFLNLGGTPVDYGVLRTTVGQVPPGGLSIQRLCEVATSFGATCEVVQGSLEDIRENGPPAIVHLGDLERPGHFVCYYSSSEHGMHLLDGTTGASVLAGKDRGQSLAAIARQASGYFLISRRPSRFGMADYSRDSRFAVSALAALLWLAAAVVWLNNAKLWRRAGRATI